MEHAIFSAESVKLNVRQNLFLVMDKPHVLLGLNARSMQRQLKEVSDEN
jgi:hypothetical protein